MTRLLRFFEGIVARLAAEKSAEDAMIKKSAEAVKPKVVESLARTTGPRIHPTLKLARETIRINRRAKAVQGLISGAAD